MPKGYHYHHFIKEILGPFLYYKNKIDPSIKILWVEQPISSPTGQNMELVNSEIKSLLIPFGLEEIDALDFPNLQLTIEELISFSCGTRFLYAKEFIKHYEFCNIGYFDFSEVNHELRAFFNQFMVEDEKKPKKIFTTRRDANMVLLQNNLENEFSNRYQDEGLTGALEDFFRSKGYEVISLSGMSVFDQISYFYNADVIAGVPGTNLCNLIYSKKDVSVIQVRHIPNYSYPWEKEFDSVLAPKYTYIDIFGVQGYEESLALLEKMWTV